MMPREIKFLHGEGRFENVPQSSQFVEVKMVRVQGEGAPLPAGMFAWYEVRTMESGDVRINGVMQARAVGGRRYIFERNESEVQARLMKWAKRILRERAKEAA